MRSLLASSLLLFLLSGCGKQNDSAPKREAVSLDDLAVTVLDHPRSYFLSDKRGGFLLGSAGPGAVRRDEWTVDGNTVLHTPGKLSIDGNPVDLLGCDSARVTPLEVIRYFPGGIVEALAPLDRIPGQDGAHGLMIRVETTVPRDLIFAAVPGPDFVAAASHEEQCILYRKGPNATVAYTAGSQGEIFPGAIGLKQVSKAIFVIVYTTADSADYLARRAHGEVDLLGLARRRRMESLLQRAYLRTSDPDLTSALRWVQLSLDALTVSTPEACVVASLPWDGSVNVRDNAIALGGFDAATGDYGSTGKMLIALAREQDTSADGVAWVVREVYEHVLASGDTGIVREVYPDVESRLARAYQQKVDAQNFFLRADASPRGSREADLQALWYFHQTIGSIFASFLGDTMHAAEWGRQAEITSSGFNRMFVDTSRNVLYDRVLADGRGTTGNGPGVLLCLDMIESEAVRVNTVKSVMQTLLRPDGMAMSPLPGDSAGKIQNWMTGQMVYALTRYDRQDISYPVTRRLAQRILTTDMVGVLPEMYGASDEGHGDAPALGAPASPGAMGEFVRSFYQDYLGVHINITTRSLALEPKLPDEIIDADFTIFAGARSVWARYVRTAENDRVVLEGADLDDTLRVTFLWMMKNGDAWRGAAVLHPGGTTTLVFGERDASALYDGKEAPLEGLRHLVGFSRRKEMIMGNGELGTDN